MTDKEMDSLIHKRIKSITKEVVASRIYRLLLVGNSSGKRLKLQILRGIVKKLEKEWDVKH